jgi:hypothetical protein
LWQEKSGNPVLEVGIVEQLLALRISWSKSELAAQLGRFDSNSKWAIGEKLNPGVYVIITTFCDFRQLAEGGS